MADSATEQSDEQAPATTQKKRKKRKGFGLRLLAMVLRAIFWIFGEDIFP